MERRNLQCGDCGQAFDAKATGRLPVRCQSCSIERFRQNGLARQAKYRERHQERVRETDRLYKAADRLKPGYSERRREGWLKRKFGLAPDDYAAMLADQGGLCAICRNGHCGVGEHLHIDHCHKTGRIRGLLCGKCNTMIGLADDDPSRLRAAANYLEE